MNKKEYGDKIDLWHSGECDCTLQEFLGVTEKEYEFFVRNPGLYFANRGNMITANQVKELRDKTNLGMMECKKALEVSSGDIPKAVEYLRTQNILKTSNLENRENKDGIVVSYIHPNNKLGVILAVNCETDFVAKSAEFQEAVRKIAMHIAATNPMSISKDDLAKEIHDSEYYVHYTQFMQDPKNATKSDELRAKIISGKMNKFLGEVCLLDQKFVMDESKTIRNLVEELNAFFKEKITIKEFERIQIV